MIQDEIRDIRGSGNGRGTWTDGGYGEEGSSLGEILKRLSGDMGTLVSQEVSLAKTELRESASVAAKGAAKLGVALTFATAGIIALTAFLVIAVGGAIDNYWLAALIVGAAELIIGGMLANRAIGSMKGPALKPQETIESLREDKAWAGRQARELRRDLSKRNAANTSR